MFCLHAIPNQSIAAPLPEPPFAAARWPKEPQDLAARVDQLEHIVLKLTELMSESNMHTNFKMGEFAPAAPRAAGEGIGLDALARGERTHCNPPGRCVIREPMRARLLSPAKALLVIARPKSPRLTASGKEAQRCAEFSRQCSRWSSNQAAIAARRFLRQPSSPITPRLVANKSRA